MAGVKIELIIRGICCLDATDKKIAKNISGKRIVDRYLEHSRMMIFNNGGSPLVYLSSADWMPRNLDNRSEVAVPILDLALKLQLQNYFDTQFASNAKASDLWNLQDLKSDAKTLTIKQQKRFQRDYYVMMSRQ
jgi:polyphosphate kinase